MSYLPPSKKPFQYKSLEDVYTESRQQTNEAVEIIGVPQDGTQEQLGTIPDDYYKQLKRLVLSKAAGGVENLVKQLLRLGQWEEIPEIDTLVLEIFLGYDIDVQVLNRLVERKKDPGATLGKLESHVNKTGVWSLYDAVDPLAHKLTKDFRSLFKELTFKVQPKINTVSVGPGEVSLTMFTNAVKGAVGDLRIGDMELEIKGAGGRLGKSDYTKGIGVDGGSKYINMLMSRGTGQHFSQAEGPILRKELSIKANDTTTNVNTFKNKFLKRQDDMSTALKGPIEQLILNLKSLTDVKGELNSKLIMNNLQVAYNQLGEHIPLTDKMTFVKNMNYIFNRLERLSNLNIDNLNYNWQDSAQYMFNHDWGMSPRELAEAFVEMRTEQMDPGSVASLISGLEKIFRDADFRDKLTNINKQISRGKSMGQHTLQTLQAALQATSYQSVDKFDRILVLNPVTMNASNIKFDPSNDAGQQLLYVYKQLKSNPDIVVQNAGVDSRNKGIGIGVRV